MPQEDLARVKDLMNEAVTDRLRPYLDENEALRLETKRLREELARVSGLNGLVKTDNLNTSTATTSAFTSPIRV
jgi:regulator of replication initiation timing